MNQNFLEYFTVFVSFLGSFFLTLVKTIELSKICFLLNTK